MRYPPLRIGCGCADPSDSSGENMLLEAEARVSAMISAFENEEITIVTDAYSNKI